MNRRRLVALFLLIFAVGCSSRPATQTPALWDRLDAILNRNAATGAIFSARVIDPQSGVELYSREADRPMIPASNMKLFVTAAALDFVGPEHRFKTYLALDGNDLWVIGTGDPATGDPRIAKAAGKTPTSLF